MVLPEFARVITAKIRESQTTIRGSDIFFLSESSYKSSNIEKLGVLVYLISRGKILAVFFDGPKLRNDKITTTH